MLAMSVLKDKFIQFIHHEKAVTAVEYGLIAAGLAVAISGVIFAFGDNLAAMLQSSAEAVAERP